jgi:hypothetical protein
LSWKVHILSKHAGFSTKSSELYEAKFGYVWNIIYIQQDTFSLQVPIMWAMWNKSISTSNGPSTEASIILVCNHRQLVFKHRSVPKAAHQTDWCYGNLASKQRIPAKIMSTKLKKEEHFSVYKDRLRAMKWKKKNIFVFIFQVGCVDLSDAYFTSCHSTKND